MRRIQDMVRWFLALGAVLLLAGCGGKKGLSDAECRVEAQRLAVRADAMVRHYGGSTVYPADVSYLLFRDGLVLFERGGCKPRELGVALRRKLRPQQRSTLVQLLPGKIAGKVQRALAG